MPDAVSWWFSGTLLKATVPCSDPKETVSARVYTSDKDLERVKALQKVIASGYGCGYDWDRRVKEVDAEHQALVNSCFKDWATMMEMMNRAYQRCAEKEGIDAESRDNKCKKELGASPENSAIFDRMFRIKSAFWTYADGDPPSTANCDCFGSKVRKWEAEQRERGAPNYLNWA